MDTIDSLFLNKFKDLKIVVDDKNSSEDMTAYNCFIEGKTVSYRKVVGLVKQYQDEIVKMLLESGSEE